MSGFKEIYNKYGKRLYGFLLSLSGNETIAEELLQETFFQAFKYFDRFEGRCSIYTWLCQIGKNAWIKEVKRRSRYTTESIEDVNVFSEELSMEEKLIRKEEYLAARRALLNLEEPYRNVFILHALSGVKLKEIAMMYEKSESWARVTYYRARMQIAQEVGK